MDIVSVLLANLPAVLISVLVPMAVWGIYRLNIAKEAKEVLEALVQRTLDKARDWLKIAMSPDSEGGVKVTPTELSAIRQKAWELIQEEVKGPVGKMLLSWGEQRVKGLIGDLLTKKGVTVSGPATTDTAL